MHSLEHSIFVFEVQCGGEHFGRNRYRDVHFVHSSVDFTKWVPAQQLSCSQWCSTIKISSICPKWWQSFHCFKGAKKCPFFKSNLREIDSSYQPISPRHVKSVILSFSTGCSMHMESFFFY